MIWIWCHYVVCPLEGAKTPWFTIFVALAAAHIAKHQTVIK